MAVASSSRKKKTTSSKAPPDSVNVCTTCGRSFTRTWDMNRHIKSEHMAIKEFQCNLCGKRFAQKGGLKTHENTHSGVKPHECRVVGCDQGPWGDASTRSRHEFTAHAPAGFLCPEGCASYKRKDALLGHIVRHHGDKAHTYTEDQLANQMTRERFNAEILAPVIAAPSEAGFTSLNPGNETDEVAMDVNPVMQGNTPPPTSDRRSRRGTVKSVVDVREASPVDDVTSLSPAPIDFSRAATPGGSTTADNLVNYLANIYEPFSTSTSAFSTPFNRSRASTPQLPPPQPDNMEADLMLPIPSYFSQGEDLGGLGIYLPAPQLPGPSNSEPQQTINPWDIHVRAPTLFPGISQSFDFGFPSAGVLSNPPSTTLGGASPSVPGTSVNASPALGSPMDYLAQFHPVRGNGLTLEEMRHLGLDMPIDPALR